MLKAGDRVEAIAYRKGKQTLPVGTKGKVLHLDPRKEGLVWVKTDKEVITPVGTGTDFWIHDKEVKKI